ncbi:MAG: apolipoprotein N-acyltransferase, partial [Candidatus Eremiobacteraeota bacterium]|nr:apolipoprotein N-acyltransferase [Candidatus Eremiobacteraeota bacterium]
WPETVVTTVLNYDRASAARVAAVATRLHAWLLAGSLNYHDGRDYNAMFLYDPTGSLAAVYDKRQLVPFAEHFPARAWLGWLPYTNLISDFGSGTADAVLPAGTMRFGPLICWESAFSDEAYAQVRGGAQFFVIATDDAWFGETAGPYQHAQIARLRAVEFGTWIVRAASTGVSGIIAPDGRYVEATDLDREASVLGTIGAPPGSVFAHIGPTPIGVACVVLYVALLWATTLRKS